MTYIKSKLIFFYLAVECRHEFLDRHLPRQGHCRIAGMGRRIRYVRSGCGFCGVESVEESPGLLHVELGLVVVVAAVAAVWRGVNMSVVAAAAVAAVVLWRPWKRRRPAVPSPDIPWHWRRVGLWSRLIRLLLLLLHGPVLLHPGRGGAAGTSRTYKILIFNIYNVIFCG